MADRIKGITVEIGGDTQGLDKALKGVNDTSRDLQKELRDVQKLLKFDPNNAELLAQRQQLLNETITNTSQKLQQLKDVQGQVQAQFERGDLGADQYRAFQREVQDTESYLRNMQNALQDLQDEEQAQGRSTQQLNNLFQATGRTIDDFADIIGTRTVRAIQQGTASSRDLNTAFDRVAQASIGAGRDIGEVRQALQRMESGEASIQGVRRELQRLSEDAQDSEGAVKDLGGELTGLVAGAGAGMGIGAIVEKALDVSNLDTTIEISMDVPEESKKAVYNAVSTVGSYIDDNEQALEGVRKQFQLNAGLTDAENQKIVKGAGTIAKAYSSIDFTELIQESYEMSKSMGISQEQALGMTKSLLDMGFPPEQLDIITEYGSQLKRAGYDASEIQGIFASGIKTGSWNIDNLLDGLKEGRIKLAEMGQGVPKAIAQSLKGTEISTKQVQAWGTAMSKGGEDGKKAMMDVAIALAGVKDETKRNQLGVEFFGTMWEDQGSKITDTILGAKQNVGDLAEGQRQLNDDTAKLDASPQQRLNTAISDLWTTLQPVLTTVAEFIKQIADWMIKNPELTATIVAVTSAIGILMGIFMAIAPIITALVGLAGFLGTTIGAIALPVLAVVGVIAGLIAIGVLLYKNWDTIKEKASKDWAELVAGVKAMGTRIKEHFNKAVQDIKDIWGKVTKFFEGIDLAKTGKDIIQGLINGIGSMARKVKAKAEEIANSIPDKIKKFLHMGSPSKLMIGLGQDTAEGLAIGLGDKISRVQDVAQKLASSVSGSVQTAVDSSRDAFSGVDKVLYDYFEAIQDDGDWANDWLVHMPKKMHDIAEQFGRNVFINMEGRDKASIGEAVKTVKNLNVTLNSPKAFDIRMASREFNKTLNKMSYQW